ncbi:Coronatine-insensitive protein 1 [Acorus gramineus]|uniref:Coronatine-insensitive protein 1 n=1 Tax=Acorus gramineus TaxID=55184 RepID=A0AAV9BHQ0_ACOGR|nr:Coronatine-insensitive protein 1 [Acorus gramineus]
MPNRAYVFFHRANSKHRNQLKHPILSFDDPRDRDAVSLVFRRWYQLDTLTRKHIPIALCYLTNPDRLWRRFTRLSSNKRSEEEMKLNTENILRILSIK